MSEIGKNEITVFRGCTQEQMYCRDSKCHRKLSASFPKALL